MSKQTLTEKMTDLFVNDESIQEWILIGKLPQDIADIAAAALQVPENTSRPIATLGSWPDEYTHVAQVIQKEFFPNAPSLERGGFMKALAGKGDVPDWLLWGQITDQIVCVANERGCEIEKKETFKDEHD